MINERINKTGVHAGNVQNCNMDVLMSKERWQKAVTGGSSLPLSGLSGPRVWLTRLVRTISLLQYSSCGKGFVIALQLTTLWKNSNPSVMNCIKTWDTRYSRASDANMVICKWRTQKTDFINNFIRYSSLMRLCFHYHGRCAFLFNTNQSNRTDGGLITK